jgi:beta-lactamase regulating signal transducer with metallopeptidase domain
MKTLLEMALWNAAAAAVLALAAAAVSRLCRKPALAHVLWLLVLVKLVTPPLVPFALPWPAEQVSVAAGEGAPASAAPTEAPVPVEGSAIPAEAPADVEELPPAPDVPVAVSVPPPAWPWWCWVLAVWLAGSLLWVGWVGVHVTRFRRLLCHACRAPGDLQAETAVLARRLGLRRCPEVWLVPGAVSPMIWALGGAPRLLFPSGLLERLDDRGKKALLAHELAHVRRGDHRVRLLELLVTGLYWWHPVLWWARRELHEAEEQCCDAWAVWALGGDGRPYALALLQAVAFVSQIRWPLPAGASGVGQVSHLKRRLAMVLQGKTSRSLSWAGLVVVGLGLLLLPLFPAEGQQPTAPAPEKKDDRKQLIDELKRMLEKLEAERPAPGPRTTSTESEPSDELTRARHQLHEQLKLLDKMAADKRRELEDIEAKTAHLRAKLKALEAAGPAATPKHMAPIPPAGTPVRPADDLEKKLDRLQKDLEELRRELQRSRGTPPGAAPGYPVPAPRGPSSRPPASEPETPPAVKPPPPETTPEAASPRRS